MTKHHLLLIADSDSQLLACKALAQGLRTCNSGVTINAIPQEGTPKSVIQALNQTCELWRKTTAQLLREPKLMGFSAIGVYLTGSKLAEFRSSYHNSCEQHQRRALPLFCGFNGLVLERFEEALAWRLGYDLICLNGPRDQERMEQVLRHTPFTSQRTVLTGLSRQGRGAAKGQQIVQQQSKQRQLVFAEQVVMPSKPDERRLVVQLLARLAQRSPHWQVTIKPRVAPHETTFHAVETHISETLRVALGSSPSNLQLSYAPLPELLVQSRLLATVSSTACFDALDLGCQPVLVGDFGLRQDLGTHFFAGSGLLRQLGEAEDLDALEKGLCADPAWLHWVGYHNDFSVANLLSALENWSSEERNTIPPQLSGYVVNAGDLSTNQLRRGAEISISCRDYAEAQRLLEIALLQRPDNRNIKRRLQAVRCSNRLMRRLALVASQTFRL